MSSSRHFSAATKREAYARSGGRCENPACRKLFPAGGGGLEYDHIINWNQSRDSSLDNCACLCLDCHRKKTGGYDIPIIRKCERIADRRMGIKRQKSGKKLPGGRDTPISITMNHGPVRRQSQSEKHRETMRKRQIGVEQWRHGSATTKATSALSNIGAAKKMRAPLSRA